ncbi:nucleotidyltransferase family protein [Granulosicoccaceae sp. 1_MG-2023]|nr:nucleotidyltransferase family protein [Granulosicoccaceae sp. 1_MG-2023]
MKAMILAAGRGERMRPLTDSLPKPLLQAGGKPLIAYHLEALAGAGVRDVVINTGWLGEQLPQTLGDGSRWHLRIHYSVEGWPALETAGGILNALPLLGDEAFLLINGDVFCDVDFTSLTLHGDDLAQLLLVDNPPHNRQGDFSLHKGRIGKAQQNRLTYAGIALMHPALFDGFSAGSRPLRECLQQAMTAGRLGGQYHAGRWHDIGTPQRLTALDASLRNCQQ